jgi:hypothetical protein
VTGRDAIAIRAGTVFAGHKFSEDTPLSSAAPLVPGADYAVVVGQRRALIVQLIAPPTGESHLGGFHFAPGGNALARKGGDETPAINPCSLWDLNFRFAGKDPRGMAFANVPGYGPAWYDIYMLDREHLTDGTSKFGATIADGDNPPQDPAGGYFSKLDYAVAEAVMKHHGKQLMAYDEYRFVTYGVAEKTAIGSDPRITKLDAPRTSKFGLHQATGNMLTWGHDGDPDVPRASLFGGSWLYVGNAGSRFAIVAYYWPDYSDVNLGARGRGDHLQLG